MEDADLVRQVAAEYIARLGPAAAIEELLECEELAREAGDDLSAQAWLDLAQAAVEQARASPAEPYRIIRPTSLPSPSWAALLGICSDHAFALIAGAEILV
jgi:hypothetical protein